jgi:hypothetical protein
MNVFLETVLKAKLGTDTPALVDFDSIYENTELNTRRTRGSVRMQINKILTPLDISKKINKLFSTPLPH